MGCKLFGKPGMGLVRLGCDNQPRRTLVDSVYDTGAGNAANTRKSAGTMVEQGVNQCAIRISGRRMDDQSGRLVDNDQMFVLECYREGNILRDGFRGFRQRYGNRKTLIFFNRTFGIARFFTAGSAHMARRNQFFQPFTRKLR